MKKKEEYIYRKEKMNIHFNKNISKDFYLLYLQHNSPPSYSSHWSGGASQPQNVEYKSVYLTLKRQ